jgi:hypothetical protein
MLTTWRLRALAAMVALPLLAPPPRFLSPAGATSAARTPETRDNGPRAAGSAAASGRPRVLLQRLTFPSIPEASYYKKQLTRSLWRASQAADWGAGEGSVIEYRFRVDALKIEDEADLVRVHCTATGELPGGKNATSRLSFSGPRAKRRALVDKVLRIVAQGVITRLAQIEHRRRSTSGAGDLKSRGAVPG